MTTKIPAKTNRELGLFRFFINQHVFINMLYIAVFGGGLILWNFVMNREAFGNFDFDIIQITTPYPGATAEEVEQLVTMPIENGLKTVEGVDEMWSVSVEAQSVIVLQLDPDRDNPQKTIRSVEREVETVRTLDLPEDGDEPRVLEITADFPVVTVGVSGDVPEMLLRDTARDLEEDLLEIDGVSRVLKNGFKEKQIWVEADLKALKRNHLSLLDLVNRIRVGDHTSPGGRLEIGGREIIVRTMGKLETVEDVERVVVRSNEEGNLLLVKDVAQVIERLERERKFTRLNGARSIELNVLKKDSGDTLEIDAEIKSLVEEYRKRVDPRIGFGYANEISFYIQRRLNVLLKNGAVGITLILLIMLLFLHPQSAFWTTTAIPFAFFGGLITMWLFGMTINLLSLFAFILVSGMLVDNGIVVSEYIERKRDGGMPRFTAVSVGVSEMSLPVFAAGITTMIAFAPLAFMSGITGKFLRQMPLVLIACLVADLLECLFILPGHLYHYDWKIRLPRFIERVRSKAQQGLDIVNRRYTRLIRKVVVWPKVAGFFLILLLIVLGVLSKAFLKFRIFPNVIDIFVIKYELPIGTTLDQTEAVASGFEAIVKTIPSHEIEAVISQVGSSGDHHSSASGTHLGEVRVYLNKANPDRTHGAILIESIREEATQYAEEQKLVKFELEKIRGGPPTGRAIELRVIGDHFDTLVELTGKVKSFLEGLEGTVRVSDDFDIGKEEYRLLIDHETVARAGLTIAQVATVVRAAFDGQEATEIKRVGETEDISVRVKLTEADRQREETLDQLTVTTPRGKQIPLKALVSIEEGRGRLTIKRWDRNRTITIYGDIDEKITTAHEVNNQLVSFLDEVRQDYPAVRFKFGGEKKEQDESMASLRKAILIALILIFVVLATLFKSYWKPIVILSVIPFALIGVFISLLIVNKSVTLLVLIGFTGLTGVVVNNSILMIETFNRVKDQYRLNFKEAVVRGASHRLRPILLTSFSTFFGVMPLGLGIGGKEPFLQDMAYTFGCGLLFCSFVTLLWIPAFYIDMVRAFRMLKRIYWVPFTFFSHPIAFVKSRLWRLARIIIVFFFGIRLKRFYRGKRRRK